MTNRNYEDDPKEIKRLIEYHHCSPIKNAKGELGISIPLTCIHLGWDKEGKSFCKIQDKKPIVCKEYYCQRVKEKAKIEKFIEGLGTNLNGIHL
jgi:Fe-S-cluster containining protein